MKVKLYKNTAKSSQVWEGITNGETLTISYGELYGRKQTHADQYPSAHEAEKALTQKVRKKVEREGYSEDPSTVAPLMPMLSLTYEEHGYKLPDPVMVQPKLDGFRCVANKRVLLSRRNLAWTAVPHILEELRKLSVPENICFDGELYAPGLSFQELQSVIKRDHPHRKMGLVEYHIFDIQSTSTTTYKSRLELLNSFIPENHQYLKVMPTTWSKTEELMHHLEAAVAKGQEGIMVKDPNGRYEHNTRSPSTQKLKPSYSDAFKVVRITTSEQGREQGRAIPVCVTKDGVEFQCRLAYDDWTAQHIYKDRIRYTRSYAIVEYKGMTPDGKPREPRAKQLIQGTMPKKRRQRV